MTAGGAGAAAGAGAGAVLAGRRCVVAGADTPLREALRAGLAQAGAAVAATAGAATRPEAERLVADARQVLGGPVDVLVTAPPPLAAASIDELDPATFDDAIVAAYKSPFVYTQAVLPDLRADGDGRIVHVTSAAGILGRAYTAHLAAGARATIALTRVVAYEEGPGVKVNAIAAGPMDGDALLGARARALVEQTDTRHEDAVAAVAERIPLGRLTTPEDILQTLLWALAPQSAFLTGEVLTVAGASELQVWP